MIGEGLQGLETYVVQIVMSDESSVVASWYHQCRPTPPAYKRHYTYKGMNLQEKSGLARAGRRAVL